jgi:hypothetical protein
VPRICAVELDTHVLKLVAAAADVDDRRCTGRHRDTERIGLAEIRAVDGEYVHDWISTNQRQPAVREGRLAVGRHRGKAHARGAERAELRGEIDRGALPQGATGSNRRGWRNQVAAIHYIPVRHATLLKAQITSSDEIVAGPDGVDEGGAYLKP